MDDYGFALTFKTSNPNPFIFFYDVHNTIMNIGRFRPVDFLFRAIRHGISTTPIFFHFFQFILTTFTFYYFSKVLKYFRFSLADRLFALVMITSAFCIKDMIIYSTAAETLMLLFFIISFNYFLSHKYFYSFFYFIICLLSKETSIVFIIPFIIISFLEKRKNYIFITGIILSTLIFILFVKSLPQIYTQQYTFDRITFASTIESFIIPLIRNYFLFVLITGLFFYYNQFKLQIPLFLVGSSIVLLYTFILLPWGSFQSWYYAHIPIPYGWVFIFLSIFSIESDTFKNNKLNKPILLITCIFSIFITWNGSNNYWRYFTEAKIAAEHACLLHQKHPDITIYSNCYEAAGQLEKYLQLESKCAQLPKFTSIDLKQFESEIKNKNESFLFLASSKCEFPIQNWSLPKVLDLKYWQIYKHD